MRTKRSIALLAWVAAFTANAAETVAPSLAAHMARMSMPELLAVGDRVHWATYYDYSNFGFIEGETSLIAVDCGWWPGAVADAMADLRERTNKPVRFIIYTHGHGDHLGGCSAIAEQDAVEVIANEAYERYRDEMVSSRLLFIARRANDQMGFLLPQGPQGSVGAGVGPGFYDGAAAYYPPTRLVPPNAELMLDGVRIRLLPAPTDIDDAVAVYLPDDRILFPGDAVIGTGPVIATPRQERGRDPYLWMSSLDALGDVPFDALLPGHGPAYLDAQRGQLALRRNRDTIQQIVDHVVRGLNAKLPRDDVIATLKLPPELRDDPDLGWYYHSLEWVARGVYTNFAGWYTDDPQDLFEIDPNEEAELLVEALDGVDAARALAEAHIAEGDRAFGGRLLAQVMRVAPQDVAVREALASALEAEAYAAESTSARNYLLMEARSLEGRYDRSRARPFVDVFSLLGSVPTDRLLANLTPRLAADTDPTLEDRITLYVPDRGEYFTLHVRRGVLRIVGGVEAPTASRVEIRSSDLVRYALGALSAREALEAEVFATDQTDSVGRFFARMEN